MPRWKFLTNHALVLCLVACQPRITAREIAAFVGITEKATRNIISVLEADGYLTKQKEGRRIRYHINPDLPMRHELHQDRDVGILLEALGWKGRRGLARAGYAGVLVKGAASETDTIAFPFM